VGDRVTNVFIVPLNSSGSTLLELLIATSNKVSSLGMEGQHLVKSFMPYPPTLGCGGRWTEKEAIFRNANNYDWPSIKRVWGSKWGDKEILLEKSPPNVLRCDLLAGQFPNIKFVFLIRNPYAFCGSVKSKARGGFDVGKAVAHWNRCAVVQRENAQKYDGEGLLIKYEQLVERGFARDKLSEFLGVDDLQCDKRFLVKGRESPIRNFNSEQAAHLTEVEVCVINQTVDRHCLSHYGYKLVSEAKGLGHDHL
jgi:hypothetical protein